MDREEIENLRIKEIRAEIEEIQRGRYIQRLTPTEKLWLNIGHLDYKYGAKRKCMSVFDDLICYCELVLDIDKSELVSKTRKNEILETRQIFMDILERYTNGSQTFIGKLFNRDHATVIHAKKKVKNILDTEPEFRNRYITILKVVGLNKEAKQLEFEYKNNGRIYVKAD